MSWPSWIWRRWSCRASRWGRATFPLHLLTLSLWNSYGFQPPCGEFLLSIYPVSGGPESKSCWGQDAFSYQVRNYRIENLKIFHWNFDLLELTGTRSSVRTRRWMRWRLGRDRTPSNWKTCPASGEIILWFELHPKLVLWTWSHKYTRFVNYNDKSGLASDKPSEFVLKKAFSTFGEVRIVDIPMLDPYRYIVQCYFPLFYLLFLYMVFWY